MLGTPDDPTPDPNELPPDPAKLPPDPPAFCPLPPSNSAIVSADVPGAAERLAAAGIVAAMRGGRLRTSWHLYNTEEDVDRVLSLL